MDLTEIQKKIWDKVKAELADEPVASPDHVERMTAWCQLLGPKMGADMEVLLAGALLHDVGVVVDRKNHYTVGRARAAEILKEVGFPEEKIENALHVLEAHSRYGGPEPRTTEAKVGQDADALEYIGAIGILRALVRGLNDGSFNGRISEFPEFLQSILAKVENTFHTKEAEAIGRSRLEYMKIFIEHLEKELGNDA
ncbi:MAG: HD domain-containing protein [Deltaproteobacteria bacterium]|nr:HD domain-containing protein [Deltaproteobacteria bacterium]